MDGITPEKTHALLEKLTHHVMTEIPVRKEMDDKIAKIDEKVDMLANYMMKELPTRQEVDGKIDKLVEYVMNEVATKTEFQELKDKVDTIIDGMDKQAIQLDIIRTEKIAFDPAGGGRALQRRAGMHSAGLKSELRNSSKLVE